MRGQNNKENKRPSPFTNLHVVLVKPKVPGNIGSVARAMKTMGLERLVLVDPGDYRTDEAFRMAYGAGNILDQARVHSTLAEALADKFVSAGFTRRLTRKRQKSMELQAFTGKILSVSKENQIAAVFGREDTGLTTDDLKLCDLVVKIPAFVEYPSLNLAQAVMVFCYTLYTMSKTCQLDADSLKLAGPEQTEGMYQHLEQALTTLGCQDFPGKKMRSDIIRSLRKIFNRAGMDTKDIGTIRGLCSRIIDTIEETQKKHHKDT